MWHSAVAVRAPRLVYVVTHPVTADTLLRGQLAFMRDAGFDVTVVASPGPELDRVAARERVRVVAVPMARPIALEKDARALVALTAALRRLRPDIVHASTPKAGLLGMLAARALSVPVRIYLLRGLRLETATGALRRVLGATERVASACATEIVCVSASLRRVAVEGGFVPAARSRVLGAGSSNGVDLARFERTAERVDAGVAWARGLAIDDEAPLVGFVGRLDRDKGIGALLDAFAEVRRGRPETRLVLVGGDLGDQAVDRELAARVAQAPGVVAVGKTTDLAPIYARLSVLAFPSLREGFPNVPLEAACAGVPVVGFRATGVVDAVVDGTTGTLVERGDVAALARAMATYLDEPALAARHGAAGRERAARLFTQRAVWDRWRTLYEESVAAR